MVLPVRIKQGHSQGASWAMAEAIVPSARDGSLSLQSDRQNQEDPSETCSGTS